MRSIVLTLCVAISATLCSAAGEQADAKAIVDKAIKAMGGETNLAKLKSFTSRSEGKFFGPDLDFGEENSSQFPDQYRFEMELSAAMLKIKQTMVFSGEKGWAKVGNGKTMPLPKEVAAAFQEYLYALGLTVNPLGFREKGMMLSLVGEMKIGERDTVGIRASLKGKPDINIYFDKETGLPAKLDLNARDTEVDKEVPHEFFFSHYKEMDGIRVPTEMVWNKDGKKFMTRQIKEIRPVERIDPGVFAEP